jgi:transcriptional repressor NrdR
MRCPFCSLDNDRVIDSRASDDGCAIRRRRECVSCKRRYTTYERVEEVTVKVVKKDNSREPYAHEKIRSGIAKACWKRPISHDAIENLVSAIANEVYANYESEIESKDLGEIVMEHLRKVDDVAFVRFASVYRQFKDVRDFVDELKPMLNGPPKR